MTHLWGVHWVPLHRAGSDKDVFARWNPPFVKLVWDGSQPPYLEDIPPSAKIIWRNYPLSEQFHGGLTGVTSRVFELNLAASWRAAQTDAGLSQNGSGRDIALLQHLQAAQLSEAVLPTPAEAAAAYLKNAAEVIAYCESRGVSRQRLVFEGPNEYPVWVHGYDGLAQLELARLRGLHQLDTGGAYSNLGVGWPGNTGPDTPPVWEWFRPVANEFGPRDYLGFHEYCGRNGVAENWGWWMGRTLKCPFRVPLLGTECGIDLGVYGPGSAKQGWLNCWPDVDIAEKARRYIAVLGDYETRLRSDGRTVGLTPYTYDGNRDDWGMFSLDMTAFLDPWLPWLAAHPDAPSQPPSPEPPSVTPPVTNALTIARPLPANRGTVSQAFGADVGKYQKYGFAGHEGLDYAVPVGTPVKATATGVVKHAGTSTGANARYGIYVVVSHGKFESWYCHLSSVAVQVGQRVAQGQLVGASGNTGASTGPHLHYALRVPNASNGSKGFVDPWALRVMLGDA